MNFKKLIPTLFGLSLLLGSCTDVYAGRTILTPEINPITYESKSNWCWETLGMCVLKHLTKSELDKETELNFIKTCKPEIESETLEEILSSPENDTPLKPLELALSITKYLKENFKLSGFGLEHYDYNEKKSKWECKKPAASEASILKTENLENFDLKEFKKKIKNSLNGNKPVLCSIDLDMLDVLNKSCFINAVKNTAAIGLNSMKKSEKQITQITSAETREELRKVYPNKNSAQAIIYGYDTNDKGAITKFCLHCPKKPFMNDIPASRLFKICDSLSIFSKD